MNEPNAANVPPVDQPQRAAEPYPEAVGGVPIEESDLPESELSRTYVPDDEQEPVDHGD